MSERFSVVRRALPATVTILFAFACVSLARLLLSPQTSMKTKAAAIGGTLAYIALVQLLRWQRFRELQKVEDPFELACLLSYVEFPAIMHASLEFGLFKTYAIPSVSKILKSTQCFTKSLESCLRRYDDTNLLLTEIFDKGNLNHPRAILALRRLNHLHSHYAIRNEDYLYTLSVFICEPIDWVNKYGWRRLTEREERALFVLFYELGSRMGIEKIPDSLEKIFRFKEDFEKSQFRFADSNASIGNATYALFLKDIPTFLHPYVKNASYCLMPPLLRVAMEYPEPHPATNACVKLLLSIRALFVKWLLPPRPRWFHTKRPPSKKDDDGKYHPRYGLYGDAYPDGYEIERLGPPKFEDDKKLGPLYDTKSGKKNILVDRN